MSNYDSDNQGRIGVAVVQLAIANELRWIFREQPTSDYGIDGHIEVVEREPSGRLIGVQIKSGTSYFSETTAIGIVYRGSKRHLDYWLHHSLPVIVVLHDPSTGRCHWASVDEDSITPTEKGWKLEVPFGQVLDASAADALRHLADVSPYDKRLTGLVFAKPWMELLDADHRLFLEAEEWVNKSSGRGSLKLTARSEDEEQESIVAEWPFVMFPKTPYVDLFPRLFPWADVAIDDDFYSEEESTAYDDECGVWDSEEGEYMFHTETYGEWRSRLSPVRPYAVHGGEVAVYRLELTLNELGRAFLVTDRYLSSGGLLGADLVPADDGHEHEEDPPDDPPDDPFAGE